MELQDHNVRVVDRDEVLKSFADNWLVPFELAGRLVGVTYSAVRARNRAGKLPILEVALPLRDKGKGRKFFRFVSLEDLQDWIAEHKEGSKRGRKGNYYPHSGKSWVR